MKVSFIRGKYVEKPRKQYNSEDQAARLRYKGMSGEKELIHTESQHLGQRPLWNCSRYKGSSKRSSVQITTVDPLGTALHHHPVRNSFSHSQLWYIQ